MRGLHSLSKADASRPPEWRSRAACNGEPAILMPSQVVLSLPGQRSGVPAPPVQGAPCSGACGPPAYSDTNCESERSVTDSTGICTPQADATTGVESPS